MKINIHLGCSIKAMESMPDKKYGLAMVDPEYGIGISKNPFRQKHAKKSWDSKPPDNKYFNQLMVRKKAPN